MLQVERSREAEFFSNSYLLMDLSLLKEAIKSQLDGVKVSLRYKSIHRGKH